VTATLGMQIMKNITVPIWLVLLLAGCASQHNLPRTPPDQWSITYNMRSSGNSIQIGGSLDSSGVFWFNTYTPGDAPSDDSGFCTEIPPVTVALIYDKAVACLNEFTFSSEPDHGVDGVSVNFDLAINNRTASFGYRHFDPGVDTERVPQNVHDLIRLFYDVFPDECNAKKDYAQHNPGP
jgi:hypothetical protein